MGGTDDPTQGSGPRRSGSGVTAPTINLAVSDFRGKSWTVPTWAHVASIQIEPNDSDGWGTAVVSVEHKIDGGNLEETVTWVGYGTAITLSTSTPLVLRVPVYGATHISLRVTTPDGDADPAAEYTVVFT